MTPKEKEEVISNYINKKGTVTLKEIAKICNVKEDFITGYRVDKKEKAIFTEFKGFNAIRKLVDKGLVSSSILEDKSQIDSIIDILTETKIIEERIERISKFTCESDAIELSHISSISKYGYLSYEALNLFIAEMKESSDNQMQISSKLNLSKEYNNYLKDRTNIPFENSDLTNPVVVRAQRETIKVINKIRKEYGELESIIIEMAREKNTKEEQDLIKKLQANNEQINKSLEAYTHGRRLSSKLKTKLRLAIDQNWKCAYSNKKIDLNVLLLDDTAYEIDHILPISLSFDDSYSNKVLVLSAENQKKGQRTSYEYFKSGNATMTFDEFEKMVLSNKNFDKKKINNLLFKGNLLDDETSSKFINRNLQDTRFASRNILNNLKQFFKYNEIDTKVFVVRGSITDQFRKKAKISKNRDEYKHHAIDALIIASIRNNYYLISKLDNESKKERKYHNYVYKGEKIYDETTGEIIEKSFFDDETLRKLAQIKIFDKEENYKFSWKVDKKINRSIADQTVYSTRNYNDGEYVIKKYQDIYADKYAIPLVNLFKKSQAHKLLIYKHDIQTFELIKNIVENYPNEKNPFAAYKKEHGFIRKYCKKGNGPIIKSLKYIDGKLNSHIDISSNYNVKDKRVVLLQVSSYRMDVYLDNGIYKFVTIRYANIKQKGDKNYIEPSWYEKQKEKKKISSSAQFMFSFCRNDIIELTQNNETTKYRFVAVNNDSNNVIEIKNIGQTTNKQTMLAIGKKIEKINKYTVDILGNYYKSDSEVLKLDF